MSRWLFLTLARRELRSGLAGFRIFLISLALGVAAIAAVQSLATSVHQTLERDGREILGGDVSARLVFNPATPEQTAALDALGRMSTTAEMRAMARLPDGSTSTLVQLKAVDDAYPLVGRVTLDGGGPLDDALARRGDAWGAVIEQGVSDRLDVAVGDTLQLGDASVVITDMIAREPDRAGGVLFTLGPRVMVARAALDDSGLIQPGSMVYYYYRVALPDGVAPDGALDRLHEAAPEAGWRLEDYRNASPRLAETIGRMATFLTLVGLTALLVGGVGVGNAVRAYVEARIATIATMKCLGAPAGLVFATYLAQVLALAAAATAVGVLVGALVPLAAVGVLSRALQLDVDAALHPEAMALAAVFGALTALTFSIWPLARAQQIPAAALFRSLVVPAAGWPRPVFALATAGAAAALVAVAVFSADNRLLAAGFVASAMAALAGFRGAAALVMRITRAIRRPKRPTLRLALANLHRPGAPTPMVTMSLGLGLTVLVAITLIQGNLNRQIADELPDRAPAFFFVDVQRDQLQPLVDTLDGIDGTGDFEQLPSLRGRLIAANGVPAADALVDPEEAWILRGDRGVSYRPQPRPSDTVIAGEWWPADYAGPPLLSIYRDIATAFDIGVGDTLTVNVLGRDITAEIANIRDIDWDSMTMNFTLVFSPSPLDAAPHTHMATLYADAAAERAIQREVVAGFPNVTTVSIRQALEEVNRIVGRVADAVRGTAGVTLAAGTLVLAGAIAAGHRRRVYESVVLKVLGARRGDVTRSYLLEHACLGLVASLLAVVFGTAAGWAVCDLILAIGFTFQPVAVAITALGCMALTIGLGYWGTWRALGHKSAPLLRND